MEINYSTTDLYSEASEAMERREVILIRVKQRAVPEVSGALRLYTEYFSEKAQGRKSLLLLLRFGWYAVRIPALWGVLNKAEIIGANVTTTLAGTDLLIRITA